jgi:hypothetical protein
MPSRTYYLSHEAWYSRVPGYPDREPEIMVSVGRLEFAIRQVSNIGVQVAVFDDMWKAFVDLPDLFAALAELSGRRVYLDEVRGILDHLGFVDVTQRTSPHLDNVAQDVAARKAMEGIFGTFGDDTWRQVKAACGPLIAAED